MSPGVIVDLQQVHPFSRLAVVLIPVPARLEGSMRGVGRGVGSEMPLAQVRRVPIAKNLKRATAKLFPAKRQLFMTDRA
jgi:hypothetical protein